MREEPRVNSETQEQRKYLDTYTSRNENDSALVSLKDTKSMVVSRYLLNFEQNDWSGHQ